MLFCFYMLYICTCLYCSIFLYFTSPTCLQLQFIYLPLFTFLHVYMCLPFQPFSPFYIYNPLFSLLYSVFQFHVFCLFLRCLHAFLYFYIFCTLWLVCMIFTFSKVFTTLFTCLHVVFTFFTVLYTLHLFTGFTVYIVNTYVPLFCFALFTFLHFTFYSVLHI